MVYMVQATIATIIACVDVRVLDNMVYMVQATIATLHVCSGQHGVHGTGNHSNNNSMC